MLLLVGRIIWCCNWTLLFFFNFQTNFASLNLINPCGYRIHELGSVKEYDNFFLPCSDLRKGKNFYQDLLDMPVKFDFSDMGMVAFKVGENEPAIILKDTSKYPDAKPTIWFVVESVPDEYQRLKAKGITFLSEPFEIHTGMAVEFEDPFGNRLGFTDYSKVTKTPT